MICIEISCLFIINHYLSGGRSLPFVYHQIPDSGWAKNLEIIMGYKRHLKIKWNIWELKWHHHLPLFFHSAFLCLFSYSGLPLLLWKQDVFHQKENFHSVESAFAHWQAQVIWSMAKKMDLALANQRIWRGCSLGMCNKTPQLQHYFINFFQLHVINCASQNSRRKVGEILAFPLYKWEKERESGLL